MYWLLRSEILSEKSISNRYYLDFNATSPLSIKVIDFLKSGDFLFGNPSSLHSTGKKSRKVINDTSLYLFEKFSLNSSQFNLIYHSGASEGINAFFKGVALQGIRDHKKCAFFFSTVDHACVVNQKDQLELMGHEVHLFEVDKNGNFDVDSLINQINLKSNLGYKAILNYTYVNNENGVVWSLELAKEIKDKTSAIIHVDAVQLVGKIFNWEKLLSELDAYTFSGHKFGSLKSIGFSFIKKNLKYLPLVSGGEQQSGYRGGTENALGILSLKLALQDFEEYFDPARLEKNKLKIEKIISDILDDKGEVVASKNLNRNLNTIFIIIFGKKAEDLSLKFDLSGIELSTGSACSSGIIKENRILLGMGYSGENSRSSLRLSFSPFLDDDDCKIYIDKISMILFQILK